MGTLPSSSALCVMARMTEVSMTVCFTPRSWAIQRAFSSSMAWRWPYWKVMTSTLSRPKSRSARKRQVVESCPPEKMTAAFSGWEACSGWEAWAGAAALSLLPACMVLTVCVLGPVWGLALEPVCTACAARAADAPDGAGAGPPVGA